MSANSTLDHLADLLDGISLYEEVPEEIKDSEKALNESENLFKEAKESYNKVDNKLIEFIGNFVINQDEAAKQKKFLKNVFFWFTMIIFAVIVLTPIVIVGAMAFGVFENQYVAVAAVIGSIIEVLTTVIVLPKIVAEYLFNKKEEESNLRIVKLMQKYSEMIRTQESDKE